MFSSSFYMRAFLSPTKLIASCPSLMAAAPPIHIAPAEWRDSAPHIRSGDAQPATTNNNNNSSNNNKSNNSSIGDPRHNNDIAAAAFHRLLSCPTYMYCTLRRASVLNAINSITREGANTLTPRDLVLDAHRDQPAAAETTAVTKLFPGLGPGLRRLALEAVDPMIRSYACLYPSDAISADEVVEHLDKITHAAKSLNSELKVSLVGATRRGCLSSRSIDILISTAKPASVLTSEQHQQQQQHAPVLVLHKLKRLLMASGYVLAGSEQTTDTRTGIATMVALAQLAPPPSSLKSLLAQQRNINEAVAAAASAKKVNAADDGEEAAESATALQQLLMDPARASATSPFHISAGPSSALNYWNQHDAAAAGNNSNTNRRIQEREETIQRHLTLNMDIAAGKIPSNFVSAKSESLMEKMLKMADRQRAKQRTTITSLSPEQEGSEQDDDEEGADELARELQFPATTKEVLHAITANNNVSDPSDVDDGTSSDVVEVAAHHQEQQLPVPKQHALASGALLPTTTSSSSSAATTNNTNSLAGDIERELEAMADERKRKKKDTMNRRETGSTSNMTSIALACCPPADVSRVRNNGFECFPLPKSVPRRIHIVYAPPERFFALQLLLTGPKSFTDFIQDRSSRFNYRLTDDGEWSSTAINMDEFDHERDVRTSRAKGPTPPSTPLSTPSRHQQRQQSPLHAELRPEQMMAAALRQGREAAERAEQLRTDRARSQRLALRKERNSPLASEADLFRRIEMPFVAPIDR